MLGQPSKSEDPPEPDPVSPPQAPVLMNRRTVNSFVNDIAFQNIHVHPEDIERLQDLRVILKRFEPEEAPVPEVPQVPVPVVEPVRENPVGENNPSKENEKPSPSPKKRTSNRKKTLNKRQIKTLFEPPFLRSRVHKTLKPRQVRPATQRRISDCAEDNRPLTYFSPGTQRRISDCTEDNKPLTYFIKKKAIRAKQAPVTKKLAAKKRTTKKNKKAKESKVKPQGRSANSGTGKRPAVEPPSKEITESVELSQQSPLSDSLLMNEQKAIQIISDEEDDIKIQIISDEEDDIKMENPEVIVTVPFPFVTVQPNPLADFIIKIFNVNYMDCNEQDLSQSVSRVQEWFQKNKELQNNVQTSEFKVPHPPPRLLDTSGPSVTASQSPLRPTINPQIMRCPTWNYQKLSSIVQNRNMITEFCAKCSRCKVIFKTGSQLPTSVSVNVLQSIPNHDLQVTLQNLLRTTDHVSRLNDIMTEKGKKIFKAAILIREKIEASEMLAPEEHSVLAEVIGILTKCNAARMGELQVAALPSISSVSETIHDRRRAAEPTPEAVTACKMQRQEEPPAPTHIGTSRKFKLTAEDFGQSPITFATNMQKKYPGISLCGIKPPDGFKFPFKKGKLETNFKVFNQYIHRMLNRWGSATRQLTAIRSIQDPKIQRSPLFAGLEVDLVNLFHTVQKENGIEACQNIDAKWRLVAEEMKLYCRGKSYTKLENLYLKYLLSYNSLTDEERENAIAEVEKCWAQRDIRALIRAQEPLWRQKRMQEGLPIDDDEAVSHLEQVCAEAEECVTHGRKTNFTKFKKMAEQVQLQAFPGVSNPSPEDVEREYWNTVTTASAHVCVHSASVDAVEQDSGFPEYFAPYDVHPWNLKLLRKSPENLLSYLGPSGAPSTCIHYGMAFSTSCWHMDPTSVPWIEYLHSGPPKIWYSISADQESKFRAAAEAICPFAVQNKDIWLSSDIIMIPPNVLLQYGIRVDRHVQLAGEYVIVYPNAYCACIDTGFTISEGIYYAPHSWIRDIDKIFTNLRNSCEPSLFSLEKLLIAMALNKSTPAAILQQAQSVLGSVLRSELYHRQGMVDRGIELMSPEVFLEQNQRASSSSWQIQLNGECAYCRCHLHLSKVIGVSEGQTSVCATHGLLLFDSAVARREQLSRVYCIILIDNAELYDILLALRNRIINSVSPCN